MGKRIARGLFVAAGLALGAAALVPATMAASPDEARLKAMDDRLSDMGGDAMALLDKAKGERLAGKSAEACFHQAAGLAILLSMHQPSLDYAALRASLVPGSKDEVTAQIDKMAADAKARQPASCPAQEAAIAQRDRLKARYASLRAGIDSRQAELDELTRPTMAALNGPNPRSACPNLRRVLAAMPGFRADVATLDRLNTEGTLNRESDLENLHGMYDAAGKAFEQVVAQKCG